MIVHNKRHPKRGYNFIRLVILFIFLIEIKQRHIINQLLRNLPIHGICSHTVKTHKTNPY